LLLPFDLTEDATADLEAAAIFLAERSEAAALKLADDLENAFSLIAQHPHIGRVREEYSALEGLRFWTSAGYLIAYLVDLSPILILAVLHGAREAASIIPNRIGRL
jgi:plasmid stabilization system protein ParE